MADEVVSERHGPVLVLRINRPEARNALNPAVLTGIGAGLQQADADPELRAVVITGTGDRAFCAGMDLRDFASGANTERTDADRRGMDAYLQFLRGEVATPVIAAVNASAVAGGFELMLGCDMAVVSSAAQFGLPEVKRGLFPGSAYYLLRGRVTLAIALELTLTGDTISAERAYELGLVNKVVPPEQVLPEAIALGERIAANGPLGVQAAKRLVRAGTWRSIDELLQLGEELRPGVFGSEDAKEGALAFIEKRPPVWKGR